LHISRGDLADTGSNHNDTKTKGPSTDLSAEAFYWYGVPIKIGPY
jgi:hypothetical protein